jgi:pantoate--beta-alanine ligase
MQVLENPDAARTWVLNQRREGTIALVPTMGALHEGHLSLVRKGLSVCDQVVATIFVNPTQFGPQEDFARYPRTMAEDLAKLQAVGTMMVFAPTVEAMYPAGASTFVEPPRIAVPLEGQIRPGHFRGVATIVLKLFNLLSTDFACFGKKDFQQLRVIQTMVRDLNLPVKILDCETVREPDGLAMSSRNRYLTSREREQALGIDRALTVAKSEFLRGNRNVPQVEELMRAELIRSGFQKIDYAVIVDPETLLPSEASQHTSRSIALIAAQLGTTRLIDNRSLD